MKLFHTDLFVLPLPAGHRFPMQRYRLLRERLEQSGQFPPDNMCVPPRAADDQLQLVHSIDWVHRVQQGKLTSEELRRIGFPWSPEMVERSRRSTGATIAAAECALRDSIAVNLAGGTHHAFADRGAGYCVFNDVAVSVRCLQKAGHICNAIIIDLDVHQGDGTAAIFQNDHRVTTVSVHAAKAFPARKQVSDFDIALDRGTETDEYLLAVERALAFADTKPVDIVYFLAGADPFEGDTLGGLKVSKSGLQQRDKLVFDWCRSRHYPLVIVMAGGYAENIDDIVDIQASTVLQAVATALS